MLVGIGTFGSLARPTCSRRWSIDLESNIGCSGWRQVRTDDPVCLRNFHAQPQLLNKSKQCKEHRVAAVEKL